MRKVFTFAILILLSNHLRGQEESIDCSKVLSEAEQAYRDGTLNDVKNIYQCLGVRHKGDTSQLFPPRMKILVEELELLDKNNQSDLSGFNDFGSFLRENAVHKSYEEEQRNKLKAGYPDLVDLDNKIEELKKEGPFDYSYFSQNEHKKAYILLTQTYVKLKSLNHAKAVAHRYLMEYPTVRILDTKDNLIFNQVVDETSKGIKRLSFGLIFGINVAFPDRLQLNVDIKDKDIRMLSGFSLGGQARIYITENSSFGFAVLGASNHIRLSGKLNNSTGFNYKHDESIRWLKVPFTYRYILEKENKEHVPIDAKAFISAGLSYLRLSRSTAEIGFPTGTLGRQDTQEARHNHNLEASLGGGMRVRLGRVYLTFGLNGNYTLLDYQNEKKLGKQGDPVFDNFGYKDNSYNLFSIDFQIGIEYRLNLISKSYRK